MLGNDAELEFLAREHRELPYKITLPEALQVVPREVIIDKFKVHDAVDDEHD